MTIAYEGFEKNFFEKGGVSIAYFEKGAGETILFLGGAGVRAFTHGRIVNILAKNYKVIIPEIPCFGESTIPSEVWGFNEYADFFNSFIASLGIRELAVAGLSFGGGIALRLAVKNGAIKKLILIDAAGLSGGYSLKKYKYAYYVKKTLFDFAHYRNFFLFFIIAKDFLVNRLKHFSDWGRIMAIIGKCAFSDFGDFSAITVPTLILWGDQDEVFPPESARVFAGRISGATLTFVSGNHDWAFFKYRELAGAIHAWLGDNRRHKT